MTDDALDVATGLRELSTILLAEETVETAMARVAAVACRCGPRNSGVTVLLESAGALSTATATDDRVRAAADCQLEARVGPIIEAIKGDETQMVSNLCTDARYAAELGPTLAALGVVSALSAPIHVGSQVAGSLNVFGDRPGVFTPEQVESTELLAAQAGMLLANLQLHEECLERVRQLQEALDSRVVIEQAKGVLMERHRIDPDAAFDRLRRSSQRENRRLRQIAEELVSAVAPGNPYAGRRG